MTSVKCRECPTANPYHLVDKHLEIRMSVDAELELAKLLLPQKLEFIRIAYETGMTWWVSSVVFCASVLAAVWVKQDELKQIRRRYLMWLWFIIFSFFLSIVFYGWYIIWRVGIIKCETNALLHTLNSILPLSEFDTLRYGYLIGTSSFALVLLTWIAFAFIFFDNKK